MKRELLSTFATFLSVTGVLFAAPRQGTAAPRQGTEGSLAFADASGQPQGFCPLKQTNVKAEISGPLVRVNVTQRFHNPSSHKIEAVYTFPLPHEAAVDDMTMRIGDRVVKGKIKRRDEARKIFDAARNRGQLASLLDQERPNIFTQAVTNIPPGAEILITISYVEALPYEAGNYNFVFPMVVGPRYSPAGTNPARITPPVTPEGTRAGHDITLDVTIDAGVPIEKLASPTHDVEVKQSAPAKAFVHLKNLTAIPNKDFVLKYDVAGLKIADAVLTHKDNRGGFFSLILQPPDRPAAAEITPKELVFVIDTSGSMHGYPLDKVKEVVKLAFDGMNPRDTFNLITFSGDEHILFPQPVPATRENIQTAWEFLKSRQGRGGTEMMKAIRAALDPTDKQDHVRIACFMTDGYVGNDMEIIAEVQKHPNARVFSFGIGSSVNRYLLDGMAKHGRGEVEYVALNEDGSAAARRFHERVRNPLLTDIAIDWNGLPVSDVYPGYQPDLFSAKPLVITGRYANAARGTLRLKGKIAGRPYVREIAVNLPASEPQHDVLATLWARTKVNDLMAQDLTGIQNAATKPEVQEAITKLGLDFRLMTQFTSFVAVEENTVTEGGKPRVIDVPVEMPEGVSYQGIFGNEAAKVNMAAAGGARQTLMPMASPPTGIGRRIQESDRADIRSLPAEPKRDARAKLSPALHNVTAGRTVEVQISLSDASEATLAKLRALGVTLLTQPNTARILVAKVAGEKLLALAALDEVRYVAPSQA